MFAGYTDPISASHPAEDKKTAEQQMYETEHVTYKAIELAQLIKRFLFESSPRTTIIPQKQEFR